MKNINENKMIRSSRNNNNLKQNIQGIHSSGFSIFIKLEVMVKIGLLFLNEGRFN